MTKLLAHRGTVRNSDGEKVTEHSLESYSAAIDFGADYVETDLFITKDGVVITSHDDHNFSKLTYEEVIKKYPEVAKFSDVVDMVKERSIETGREVGLTIEIKKGATQELTQQAASAAIAILVEKEFTSPDKLYINSFNADTLKYINDEINAKYLETPGLSDVQLIKIVPVGSVLWSGFLDIFKSVEKAYANVINTADRDIIDGYAFPSNISRVKPLGEILDKQGKEIHTWTAHDGVRESYYNNLLDRGADAIYVDDTQAARTAIEKYNGMETVEYGKKGDDAISVKDKTTVYAMQGNDTISIGGNNNKIYADGGDDLIVNRGNNSYINGGSGDDFIYSVGSGNTIYGGAGNNVIHFSGDDTIIYDHNTQGNNLVVGGGAINIEGYEANELSFLEQQGNLVIQFNDGGDIVVQNGVDSNGQVANKIMLEGNSLDIDSLLATDEGTNPTELAQPTQVEVNGLSQLEVAHAY
ncbi:glycerophosphoryl diester phosphodiesterase [Serratia sp. FGI94]|uniref:glycerophosphodiester phosphodiesterase family protein n=1 Tax=Serratia sp. FGI94 TaxID=671990 RepID=UPI0002A7219E|nr:glycerophosphodiester phosphodiesterase family protein [Serratia sp. FGI94]AGB82532.1 glycerophosphoryl diester phosphodiesterase [Serratia sp. FGI94]